MNKTKEQLQKEIAFWQDKLNRSRKESLRSIRALHLQRVQGELEKLEKSAWLKPFYLIEYYYDRITKTRTNRQHGS